MTKTLPGEVFNPVILNMQMLSSVQLANKVEPVESKIRLEYPGKRNLSQQGLMTEQIRGENDLFRSFHKKYHQNSDSPRFLQTKIILLSFCNFKKILSYTSFLSQLRITVAENQFDIYFKILTKLIYPKKPYKRVLQNESGLPSFRVLLPGYRKYLDAMGSCR